MRKFTEILLVSLGFTAVSALIAVVFWQLFDVRFNLAFVYLRWFFVAVLLCTPLLYQFGERYGYKVRIPWALRTPWTALLLTTESIIFDIISARFFH